MNRFVHSTIVPHGSSLGITSHVKAHVHLDIWGPRHPASSREPHHASRHKFPRTTSHLRPSAKFTVLLPHSRILTHSPQIWARFTEVSPALVILVSFTAGRASSWLTVVCDTGKVKSQTPKVEPAEKAKTPKGRAHKREIYTRRFVNVAVTGGKRKVCPFN